MSPQNISRLALVTVLCSKPRLTPTAHIVALPPSTHPISNLQCPLCNLQSTRTRPATQVCRRFPSPGLLGYHSSCKLERAASSMPIKFPPHLAPDLYPEPLRCNLHAVDS
ncbi:hypothetical protein RB1237 [Rhodopirellula baltica SH 1]|uniref:Uncharacterized protein n=1 Tax=Rhodopirellula baltica (strain DSM 10527 / NCIMB 13988 / SH1) TaxID=243090 RepID=Q7UXM4_RHOBA|nr:hypothetical protein RB1237 [Rhodopirellula baltica SH 1]